MNIDLTGKIALVTGSGVGIGREVAKLLAQCGAKVAVNFLSNVKSGTELVQEIKASGGEAAAFQADLTDVEKVNQMIRDIESTFSGTVDILVNNAGGLIKRVKNDEIEEEVYNKIMDVNLKSCVFVTKAVLPGMKQKKYGKIVNMSSLAAHDGGGPGASIYAASKGAVISYTKGLAKEVAGDNINVNAVAPGFIGGTPFHNTFTPKESQEAIISKVPLGRGGEPVDVANLVLYLVSDLSSYLTGETVDINGGLYMR